MSQIRATYVQELLVEWHVGFYKTGEFVALTSQALHPNRVDRSLAATPRLYLVSLKKG